MNVRRLTPAQADSNQRENQRRQNAKTRKLKGEPRCSAHNSPWYQMEILSRNDVAELFGVTPRAVGLLERKAIYKIRKALQPFVDHAHSAAI